MRFNTAIVCALAAFTPLTSAAPTPAWNDKGPEAAYKFATIACTTGALICNTQGKVIGTWTLGAAGVCCSAAAAAVTASQSEGITSGLKTAGSAISSGTSAVGSAVSSGAGAVGSAVSSGAKACKDAICKAAGKKKDTSSILPTRELQRQERKRPMMVRYTADDSDETTDDESEASERYNLVRDTADDDFESDEDWVTGQ